MYTVTMKKNIEIDEVEAGSFVAEVLKSDFEFIAKEVNELHFRLHTLKEYERQDLLYNMEIYDAMKTLLRYYMTLKEYNEFMEIQRCYGNVR